MEPSQRTPLFDFHQRHGARLVPFAGWEMPVQYAGILEEHRAVRERVGLFDVSHMGEAWVQGAEAEKYLNRLLTNDVSRLKIGRGLYTVMCYEDGGVVDDLIVYRTAEDTYLLVLNASNLEKDLEWMVEKSIGFEAAVKNASDDFALLAVQGPRALELLQKLGGTELSDLPRFGIADTQLADLPVRAARTGYTGEDGFEIFVAPADAEKLAEALVASGAEFGLALAGLGARDSLRLEAGYPLYGHELSNRISPLEAGLGWVVKWKKPEPFIGQAALSAQKDAGIPRRLYWFRLGDRRIAREGSTVMDGETPVGKVLSGSLSPLLNRAIGSALVEASADPAGLAVDIRGKLFPLDVAKPPLHQVEA
jgi:aminomethyltransferase